MSRLQLVKSASDTSVTSIDVTNCFIDAYDVYHIVVQGHITTTNSLIDFRFLDSSSTAITSGYRYGHRNFELTSGSEPQSTSADRIDRIIYTSTGDTFAAKLFVYNPFSSSLFTHMTVQSSGFNSSNITYIKGGGTLDSTTSVTGFTIFDATFSNIDIDVYGVL
jgi:hypothetical protein